MPPVYTYTEATGDDSPLSASFAPRAQTASGTFYTVPTQFRDMPNRIIDVLGYTGTKVLEGDGAGRLNRVLPLRHPQFQWLFADSFRVRGKGVDWTTVTPSPGLGSPLITASFPLYARYTCEVGFGERQFNVWSDAGIRVVKNQTFYPKDDTGSGGSPDNTKTFAFAEEWMRFCTFELAPTNQFIDAKSGLMKFRVDGGAKPNNVPFQDAPRMFLPDSALTVRWYAVPYRYLTSPNSYLRNFIGYINQTSWGEVPTGGNAANPSYGPYSAGSLLYLGAKPTAIYSNVVPDEGLLAPAQSGNGFSRSRLCDLEMQFLFTARRATKPPPDFSTVNRNWITAGWNLLPHLPTRGFVYASSYDQDDENLQKEWRPSYPSFPFQLLFTDPDTQPGSPLLDP